MRAVPLQTSPFQFVAPALIVFLSGASALTYEIVWQREMYHILGASAPATAAILTAIFLGIAFGSLAARWLLTPRRNAILLLAVLEMTIAGWAILLPSIFAFADTIYVSTAHTFGEDSSVLFAARFIYALTPVLPATLCMGATIPVMVSAFGFGKSFGVSWIYGINILGAVTGALLTGLFWIRTIGQSETTWVAVGLNVAVAVVAIAVRKPQRQVASETAALPQESEETADSPLSTRSLTVIYFAAGLIALGLEIVWLRMLGIVNTNSTVTFSLTLTFYLGGMGLGSLIGYPVARRWLAPFAVLAFANLAVAISSLITYPVVYLAPWLNQSGIEVPVLAGTLTLSDLYRTEAQIVLLLLFLPAVFMGMVYPAVCECMTGDPLERKAWVARAYFWGTLGSVGGVLVTSLLLVPLLGLHATLGILIAFSALLSMPAIVSSTAGIRKHAGILTLTVTLIVAVGICLQARPILRNTIAQRVGHRWMEYSLNDTTTPSTEVVRFKAGMSGTVIIKRETASDEHLVYVDDQLVASTNIEAKVDALMLAHLPLLLHPAPANELTVGFGSGGTSHAITTHDIPAYCAEIEAEVPRSAQLLTGQNYEVFNNPLFHLIINDARDHLKITRRTYDVIATDVTNLQYKQNSSLYTVEYFELMKQRLSPKGVACAWIPMAAIAKRELQILMKSFQTVFPHSTLWFMNHTHTNFGILIGTPDRIRIDFQRFEEGFRDESVSRSMKEIGLTSPMQLLHCLHLDEDGYRTFCGDVPVHTDNNPVLEFSSPLSFYQYNETFCENLAGTLAYRPADFQPFVSNGPAGDSPDWERHRIASDCGCRVILCMYQYITLRGRGEAGMAMKVLKEAISTAQRGMDAWPQDQARERFYINFFDEANRWASSAVQ